MSYQSKGLQISLLIHAAIFMLITNTGISESRLSQPVVIDFGIIKEVVEEPAPVPPPEEKNIEEKPKLGEIAAPPKTKVETIQKKESVRAKKPKAAPKKIARAEKKETPPAKQEEIKEQPATAASDPAPPQPSDDNKILGSAFSENSAVATPAPGGSGKSSDSEGVEGSTGPSESGSGSGGSAEGTSDNLTFGSASGPKYRHKEIPVYPSMARRLGKEGKVVLRLTIDENGNLVNIEVIEDSGYGFADAAIAAVKRSTFIPPKMNGKPIQARALLPVKFTLR
jgi:periplasmic protein TonB